MEMAFIVLGVIAVAVLGIFVTIPQGATQYVSGNVTELTPHMLKLTKAYVYPIEYVPGDEVHKYIVRISTVMTYLGNLQSDSVIFPVLEFKDQSAKMVVEDGLGKYIDEKYYPYLQMQTKDFHGLLKVEIDSLIPPITEYMRDEKLIEGQTVFIDKDILITLMSVDTNFAGKISNIVQSINPTDALLPDPNCGAKFKIECPDAIKTMSLYDNDEEREETIVACGTNVKINIKSIEDCADVYTDITYYDLTPREKHDINETMRLGLWRDSDCVRLWDSSSDLFEHCFEDYLGRYNLQAQLITT